MSNILLQAGDLISGQEARATLKINGSIHEMFFAKNVEATCEKNKEEVKLIGSRATHNKTSGWSGSGSMNIYYITSLFRKMALQYIKTGKDVYFDMTVVNDDPSTTVGKQTTVLYGCNIDGTILAKFDIDTPVLDEDVDFTFTDVDYLDQFGNPIQ